MTQEMISLDSGPDALCHDLVPKPLWCRWSNLWAYNSHEARRGNGGGQHWLGLTAGCEFSTENQSRLASVTGMPLINVDSNLTCDQAFFFFRERKSRRTAKGRRIEKRDRRPWDLVFHNWLENRTPTSKNLWTATSIIPVEIIHAFIKI